MAIACPDGYDPDKDVLAKAMPVAKKGIKIYRAPAAAAKDADILYTDVWASMGQEAENEQRKKVFKNFQINAQVLKEAKKDAMVMHCLPAHRGEEITADVLEGPQSIVIDQAENRLHVQKAILEILL